MSEGEGISNRSGPASAAEPSMEEILASIRRILSEEEGAAKLAPNEEDELLLTASMRVPVQEFPASATEPPVFEPELSPDADEQKVPPSPFASEPAFETPFVPEPSQAPFTATPEPVFPPIPEQEPALSAWGEPAFQPEREQEQEKEYKMEEQVQSPAGLVGEQAATEIANSVGALVRSVSVERAASVGRAGVTIEDIVREEVKPVLKAWLDTHLPSLVERVVRAEINRVMDRAQS